MEFLEGPDFNSLIVARDPCLEGNRLRFIRQAAEAIGGRPRRRLHPPRRLPAKLPPRRKDGRDLKLIDFGVTVPATPQFLQPGVRTGNPNYMAPEIVRRKPTDQRVDVFAFGDTAYEICTGELPWLRGHHRAWPPCRTTSRPPTSASSGPRSIPSWPRRFTGAWRPSRPSAARRWTEFLQAIKDVQAADVA